jgi:hypothetical protein
MGIDDKKRLNSAWLILLILLCGCREAPIQEESNNQIEDSPIETVSYNDSTISEEIIQEIRNKEDSYTQKFFYPNMSYCGGAVYGIYKKGELIRIESRYGAELGFSSREVDFDNGEIVKISYREHFAEWGEYSESYPNEETYNPERMTYSDTLYVLEFGKERSFKKFAGEILISTAPNEELIIRLLKCVETMKNELETEKNLVKG